MTKGRNSTIVGFRVSDEEWEHLRSAAARAGRDESVGLYTKRVILREAGRPHKRRGNGNEPLATLGSDGGQTE